MVTLLVWWMKLPDDLLPGGEYVVHLFDFEA
jgi:hypothetical protein